MVCTMYLLQAKIWTKCENFQVEIDISRQTINTSVPTKANVYFLVTTMIKGTLSNTSTTVIFSVPDES